DGPTPSLADHAALVAGVDRAARRLEVAVDSALRAGPLPDAVARRLNDGLARLEQLLTDDDGAPESRWFRHVVYGWNIYSLYDGQPFPGLFEAVRLRDAARTDREAGRVLRALERMRVELETLGTLPGR
ncbi:MAG: transferrin receptor-like dimerization domain-containing protein, partial [Gemmatimonadales bacterium]|nr:transferrin receptor-like dimerization domain-containing protein [Gemmatimonadales bacterium]